MKKIPKTFKTLERLETLRSWDPGDFDGPIDKIITMLNGCKKEAEEKGWHKVYIDVEHYYEDVSITVKAWRPETRQEYEARWDHEKRIIENKKRREKAAADRAAAKLAATLQEERELYEKLKEKFGDA